MKSFNNTADQALVGQASINVRRCRFPQGVNVQPWSSPHLLFWRGGWLWQLAGVESRYTTYHTHHQPPRFFHPWNTLVKFMLDLGDYPDPDFIFWDDLEIEWWPWGTAVLGSAESLSDQKKVRITRIARRRHSPFSKTYHDQNTPTPRFPQPIRDCGFSKGNRVRASSFCEASHTHLSTEHRIWPHQQDGERLIPVTSISSCLIQIRFAHSLIYTIYYSADVLTERPTCSAKARGFHSALLSFGSPLWSELIVGVDFSLQRWHSFWKIVASGCDLEL